VDLVGGENLTDFFDFLNYHVEVVSFLEKKLLKLDVRELFVEALEELRGLFKDLVG
jgi:hypothetical protein